MFLAALSGEGGGGGDFCGERGGEFADAVVFGAEEGGEVGFVRGVGGGEGGWVAVLGGEEGAGSFGGGAQKCLLEERLEERVEAIEEDVLLRVGSRIVVGRTFFGVCLRGVEDAVRKSSRLWRDGRVASCTSG